MVASWSSRTVLSEVNSPAVSAFLVVTLNSPVSAESSKTDPSDCLLVVITLEDSGKGVRRSSLAPSKPEKAMENPWIANASSCVLIVGLLKFLTLINFVLGIMGC